MCRYTLNLLARAVVTTFCWKSTFLWETNFLVSNPFVKALLSASPVQISKFLWSSAIAGWDGGISISSEYLSITISCFSLFHIFYYIIQCYVKKLQYHYYIKILNAKQSVLQAEADKKEKVATTANCKSSVHTYTDRSKPLE